MFAPFFANTFRPATTVSFTGKRHLPHWVNCQPGTYEEGCKHCEQEVAQYLTFGIVGHLGGLRKNTRLIKQQTNDIRLKINWCTVILHNISYSTAVPWDTSDPTVEFWEIWTTGHLSLMMLWVLRHIFFSWNGDEDEPHDKRFMLAPAPSPLSGRQPHHGGTWPESRLLPCCSHKRR